MNVRVRRVWPVVAGCVVAFAGAVAEAQPQRGPGGGASGFGGAGGFGGGPVDLLRRPDVRRDLELFDDQVAKLEQLWEGRRERMQELFSGLRDMPQEQRVEAMRERAQKARGELEAEISKILFPPQMKRLKQLETQWQLRVRGGRGMADVMAQQLELSEAEKEQLQAKAETLEEETRKKIAELRAQAQNELLKSLPAAKQAQWKEQVGEPLEFQMEAPRPEGDRPQPPAGAPAGRGGRRGGR